MAGMDEETKECLDSLIAGTAKKSKKTMRDYARESMARPAHSFESAFKSGTTWDREPEPEPRKSTHSDFSEVRGGRTYTETKRATNISDRYTGGLLYGLAGATATLCVNTAKACIVLRAPVSGDALHKFAQVEKETLTEITWNQTDGVFEFPSKILPQMKELLKTLYASVSVLGVQKQVKTTKFDQLMSKLTKEDKNKIYRLLAGIYHPDKGGDKETMILINLVFKGGD